ncbi:hypothetical protein [Streptomyces noursei]|uniref:hypothetical protein n=1 Tax=Streptomyces noursei TaxID=1971 RepID=UPI0022A6952D|nr:hypothetical protein [Streptomyces noursei]MCZ1021283.1 hypothetical protein [Streptomyces noursei]
MTVADFIADQRTSHHVPHAVSCRALEVSQSWFYKWLGRTPTARDERRADLALAIQEAFDRFGGTYGSPRIHVELRPAFRVIQGFWSPFRAEAAGRRVGGWSRGRIRLETRFCAFACADL